MTQTLIEKLEALATESHEFSGEKYVYLDDLRAIIEQYKTEGAVLTTDRMVHDFPTLQAFYVKHALGSKTKPSCFKCGSIEHKPAIKHLELPDIYICETCHPSPDIVAELVKALEDSQLETLIENSDGFWVDGEFRIEGSALMSLLRNVAKEMMG